MSDTQLEKDFTDYYGEIDPYGDTVDELHIRYVAKQAFAAGVDFATKKHIKDLKKNMGK